MEKKIDGRDLHMFAVCHMLASMDGKIDGAFFGMPKTAPALKAYTDLREGYRCQATLYGMTTMLEGYADGKLSKRPAAAQALPKEDWVNPEGRAMGNFIVSMDPKGELAFSSHVLEKKGRPAAHVIQALTQQVSPEYLSYLKKHGVSYLIAGKERMDCAQLLLKLGTCFGIDRLMIAGGGVTNWSFLQEGLIDEVSLVVAPVVEGSTTAVSLFERAGFLPPHAPVALSILEAKTLEGDTLWLRYVSKGTVSS